MLGNLSFAEINAEILNCRKELALLSAVKITSRETDFTVDVPEDQLVESVRIIYHHKKMPLLICIGATRSLWLHVNPECLPPQWIVGVVANGSVSELVQRNVVVGLDTCTLMSKPDGKYPRGGPVIRSDFIGDHSLIHEGRFEVSPIGISAMVAEMLLISECDLGVERNGEFLSPPDLEKFAPTRYFPYCGACFRSKIDWKYYNKLYRRAWKKGARKARLR